MRGTVIICGLILTFAMAVAVFTGVRSREARANDIPAVPTKQTR